jgi:ATP phosphoribosyltransferase
VRSLETLLERQKRELKKSEGLLAEVDEQVKGVQATRDEVQIMLSGGKHGENENEVRSTTPDVEPPVVEALTPPADPVEELHPKSDVMQGLDDLAGLGELEPEIVALLRADMGLNRTDNPNLTTGHNDTVDDYAP